MAFCFQCLSSNIHVHSSTNALQVIYFCSHACSIVMNYFIFLIEKVLVHDINIPFNTFLRKFNYMFNLHHLCCVKLVMQKVV